MQDVDKLKKLIKALDELVELGEEVFEDGKIGLDDITKAPKLVNLVQDLLDAWKVKEELIAEIKDIDVKEFKELLDVAFN